MATRSSVASADDQGVRTRRAHKTAQTEITDLRDRVESLMNERVSPAVTEAVGEAEAIARGAASAVRRNANALIADVRANPLTSAGIAAAAGFMLALWVRR